MTTKHQRYGVSAKGKARNFRYYSTTKGKENIARKIYAKYRKRLRDRIVAKQIKIQELERMINDVQKV